MRFLSIVLLAAFGLYPSIANSVFLHSIGAVTAEITNTENSNRQNTGSYVAIPSELRVSIISENEVRLQWLDVSNAAGYNVYRNGNYYVTVWQSSMNDQVEPGRTYEYSVAAFTSDEQYSVTSAGVQVNTGDSSTDDSSDEPNATDDTSNSGNNSAVPEGYELVFSDEFRGQSLDYSKWNSRYRWGPDWIINGEKQYYVDQINQPDFGYSPFTFDGEHLTINATRTPENLQASANWQGYLSGALTTHNHFNLRYGYIEIRAKLPQGRGLWPAFWLLHNSNNNQRPEIDVMEMLGDNPNVIYNTYHYYDSSGSLRSTPSFTAPGADYSAGFHTYAVKWEPGVLTWYVDGEERNRFSDNVVSSEDMYLLVNLAVGGSWPGNPDSNTPLPAQYTIDYIRAWKKP